MARYRASDSRRASSAASRFAPKDLDAERLIERPARGTLPQTVKHHVVEFRDDQLGHVHPQELRQRITGDPLGRGVAEGVVSLQVDLEDDVPGVVDEILQLLLGLPKLLLVLTPAQGRPDGLCRAAQGLDLSVSPAPLPAAVAQPDAAPQLPPDVDRHEQIAVHS